MSKLSKEMKDFFDDAEINIKEEFMDSQNEANVLH